MFSYSALVKAYHNGTKMGDYKGHSVYPASCEDLPRIGIHNDDYYIIFDVEQKYLYQRGRYIAIVSANGDLSWLDDPIIPEEVEDLIEEEKRQIRKTIRQAEEVKKERQRATEMELVDFEMELEDILMELEKMMDDTCVWGEV